MPRDGLLVEPLHPAAHGVVRLVEAGLLVRADKAHSARRPTPAIPARSRLDDLPSPSRPEWTTLALVATLLWRTRQRLKLKGLEAAVEAVRRRRPAGPSRSDPAAALARFRAARRLVPAAPNCLTDSLALSAFLAVRNIRCDLVFGVKLDSAIVIRQHAIPFVQQDDDLPTLDV